jgi:hypothetical protein
MDAIVCCFSRMVRKNDKKKKEKKRKREKSKVPSQIQRERLFFLENRYIHIYLLKTTIHF